MSFSELRILDLVPALRPDWRSPVHLSDWCASIEGCLAGGTRAMCSVPFQHHKSMTTLVGAVWLLLKNSRLHIIILTHSHEKAAAMGKELRELWKLAGGTTRKGFDTINDWQTPEGGGCVVMSAAQSKLGYPCDVLLVDDPLDEKEYMLADVREKTDETIAFYTARAATHLDSVLIVASRWHPQDPIGLRIARTAVKWTYFFHAGISDYGTPAARAFAPDVLSLEKHLRMRAEMEELDPSLRMWHAQVQNDPLPDALGFFAGHTPFFGDPPFVWPIFGIDAAFTSGKKSDYFAAVGGTLIGDLVCVFRVIRHQRGLASAIETLRSLKGEFPTARFVSYVSGPEKGIYNSLFEVDNIEVEQMPARWSKGVRAQKAAVAWRDKRILVCRNRPWTGSYIAEHNAFDGREDAVDDQVDGTVSMYDAIQAGRPAAGFSTQFTFGRAEIS